MHFTDFKASLSEDENFGRKKRLQPTRVNGDWGPKFLPNTFCSLSLA